MNPTTHTPEKLRELLRSIEGRVITVSERAELFGIIHDYANLIEREMGDAVPFGWYLPTGHGTGFALGQTPPVQGVGWRPLYTHSPAQAAQPGKCCAHSGTFATQPAQSANAEKVHEVIEILRSGGLTSDPELADKLEAAIKGGA